MGARIILWALVLIVAVALYAPLFLKASDYLKGHRANLHGLSATDDLKTTSHARSFAMKEQ